MATRAKKELAETDSTRKKGGGGQNVENGCSYREPLHCPASPTVLIKFVHIFFLSLFITNTTDQNKYKSLSKSCVHCHSCLKVYNTEAIVHSSDGECISAVCSF